ncbi:MAG: cobalamin-dependent protein [Candidatus Syntrophoarchaeum sp.]|nr:cobalamin-dependent protein [Candidatus Syntrophoarchaeum sp.]
MDREEFLNAVKDALVVGDKETCVNLINENIDAGIATPLDILRLGLGAGMTEAGDKYESGEYFVPEMLMCVDVMDAAMEIVMPRIKEEMKKKGTGESPGKVVIGVVEGDIHDIGKTITASLLEAAGFEVFDLGRDVPAEDFIKKAKEVGADVIAASTLMTPTLEVMEELHEDLEEEGMRDKVKTIIGGGATSDEFAEEIGADGYASDAVEGVDAIKQMVEEIKMAMAELEKRVE